MIDILREIENKGVNFILECEEIDDEVLYVGKIMGISDKLLFKTFDTLGNWDDDLLEVAYNDITTLRYSEYNKIYSKYLS
jgi:hypothetical protein